MLGGFMRAAMHQQSIDSTAEREMTLGVVQKEIRIGMSQADVAAPRAHPTSSPGTVPTPRLGSTTRSPPRPLTLGTPGAWGSWVC
jgi:hypothetical protein